jgi:hypothetical protein
LQCFFKANLLTTNSIRYRQKTLSKILEAVTQWLKMKIAGVSAGYLGRLILSKSRRSGLQASGFGSLQATVYETALWTDFAA